MLKINGFGKLYGSKRAVSGLDLEVKAGEIFGFIGHNGAGKTTTIKSIVGILEFEEGDITVKGMSVKTQPIDCKRVLAYIPDTPDLYEMLTGFKYINLIADFFQTPKVVRETGIKRYADAFEMTERLGDPISSYSHGMKQKIAVIAALVHNPELLVLDEPFVGLDPNAAFTLKGIMREICEKGGAIFFSTHVLEVAEKLCDRIGIIRDGKLVRMGDTEEVCGDKSLEEVFLQLKGETDL